MMAHRKTITVTALHARLKKAIAALPCLRRRSEKASSSSSGGEHVGHAPASLEVITDIGQGLACSASAERAAMLALGLDLHEPRFGDRAAAECPGGRPLSWQVCRGEWWKIERKRKWRRRRKSAIPAQKPASARK
jgi:hypothetical protein